jgi:hypothetical protein
MELREPTVMELKGLLFGTTAWRLKIRIRWTDTSDKG